MTRVLAIGVAVAFVALLAYGLTTQAADTTIDDALGRREAPPAPGFELRVLAAPSAGRSTPSWDRAAGDGRVSLDELLGTPVVINFWASWCEPCRIEAPVLERGAAAARRRGALVVGIDQQDATEDARAFLRRFSVSFAQVRDPGKETSRAWGVTGIPETFFIGREGRVVGHVIGVISEDEMNAGVDAAISGRPVRVKRGGDRRPSR